MNKITKGCTPIYILVLSLLCGAQVYGQNVPNTETQPAGTANTFTAPPDLPSEGVQFNYNRSYTPMVPITNSNDISEASPGSDVKISTTYRDGFNRGIQTIIRNVSNNAKKHVVIPVDTRSRLDGFSYLPYATEFDNSVNPDPTAYYRVEPFDEQKAYYNNLYPGEGYTPFSRSQYISDANQRTMKSYAPGKSQVGQDRGTTTKSITNDAGVVRIWGINSSGLPQSTSLYPADVLYGSVSTSVEGAEVTVFKDKEGRVIYQKEIKSLAPLPGSPQVMIPVYGTTHNVYDELGQLRFTIPPGANALVSGGTLTQPQVDALCYQYNYDDKGRLIRKKLPGKAQELFVYDKLGRLVFYQDGAIAPYKWRFTIYDVKGRAICTGLYTNEIAQADLQAIFSNSNTYAAPDLFYYVKNYELYQQYPSAINNAEILSYSYYDNYQDIDPTDALWATYNSTLQFTEQHNTATTEPVNRSKLVLGMPTGSKVKIMPTTGTTVAQTGQWRETANYYDDKGRSIYTVSRDLNNGNIVHAHYAGSKYDFAGRALISKHVSVNANSTDGNHYELTRNYYDALTGALTETQHKIDNNGAWNVMALYTYDELGRVKRKVLGNYGEVRDYSYNIRGQLEGINPVYAMTGNKEGESRTFGESLKYDYGFSVPRYDGLVSGMIWRGSTAANNNAYGYRYDPAGRLTTADYRKWEPASYPYLYDTWRNDKTDYSVSNLQYDLNGNILSMKQRGMDMANGITTPVDIDKLSYTYNIQTNQLLSVYDSVTVNYGTGDFQNPNGVNADYFYSVNGTLIKDNNKGIFSVAYSYLHKPTLVMMTPASNRIGYSYDATGSKVQQFSIINGVTKLTDYVGNFVYEDNVLKYIFTPEGRSVYDATAHTFKEEFFVKDHLDNVRSVVDVYTYPILQYLASYEIASANLEGLFFDNMDEVRQDKPLGSPGDNKAGSLNGDDPARRIGTSALLRVMAGDKVELNANSFYDGYNAAGDRPVSMEDMLGSVVGTLTGGAGGFEGSESHNTKLVNDVFTMPNYQVFDQLVNQQEDPQKPKAYLNYLLFNERMELVPEMSGAFQATGNGSWAPIGTTAPMVIPANGYLAVYLSNRSTGGGDVFFDQLVVRMTTGKLREEAHYYPFGLPIGSMGSAAVGFIPNKNKYQSNEYTKDLGLNWMDFQNRQYDPQTGRFLSIDPLAEATADVSPYAAMDDNPVSNVDPLGLQPEPHHQSYIREPFRPYIPGFISFQSRNQTRSNAPGNRDYDAEDAATAKWFADQRREQWMGMLGVALKNQGETVTFNNNGSTSVSGDQYGNMIGEVVIHGSKSEGKSKPGFFGKVWGGVKKGWSNFGTWIGKKFEAGDAWLDKKLGHEDETFKDQHQKGGEEFTSTTGGVANSGYKSDNPDPLSANIENWLSMHSNNNMSSLSLFSSTIDRISNFAAAVDNFHGAWHNSGHSHFDYNKANGVGNTGGKDTLIRYLNEYGYGSRLIHVGDTADYMWSGEGDYMKKK